MIPCQKWYGTECVFLNTHFTFFTITLSDKKISFCEILEI